MLEKIAVRQVENSTTTALPITSPTISIITQIETIAPTISTFPWWGWLGIAGIIAGAGTGIAIACMVFLHWLVHR